MHCLPVRRNVVVADAVLDSPRSVVVRQAHNRLWAQMAVLHRMLAGVSAEMRRRRRDDFREGEAMKDVGQRSDRMTEVAGLKHALPYLRLFQGKTFVVKLSGEAIEEEARLVLFLEQIEVLHRLGIRVVLVHGGGPQTTALADRLGLATQKIDGRRVTDAATLEAAVMAMAGKVNTALLAVCRRAGVAAVGLSGVDADLVEARKRPPVPAARTPGSARDRLRFRRRHRGGESARGAEAPRRRLRSGRGAARR